MPKPSVKQRAAKRGVSKKVVRKENNAATRFANGGKTRAGRFIKGAVKIGVGAIPIVGGGIADALFNNTKNDGAKDLPPALSNNNSEGGISIAPPLSTAPIVQMTGLPPALAPATDVKQASTIMQGGGGGSISEEAEMQGKRNTEYAQERTYENKNVEEKPATTAPKSNKKVWYIISAILVVVVVLYFVIKKK